MCRLARGPERPFGRDDRHLALLVRAIRADVSPLSIDDPDDGSGRSPYRERPLDRDLVFGSGACPADIPSVGAALEYPLEHDVPIQRVTGRRGEGPVGVDRGLTLRPEVPSCEGPEALVGSLRLVCNRRGVGESWKDARYRVARHLHGSLAVRLNRKGHTPDSSPTGLA